jgi:hypothetical protein
MKPIYFILFDSEHQFPKTFQLFEVTGKNSKFFVDGFEGGWLLKLFTGLPAHYRDYTEMIHRPSKRQLMLG